MHKHSEFSGNELLSKAAEHLQKNGERWTALRKAILQTLIQFDTPASAYDITERASTLRGKKIAANSVYRILELFVTHNIASRVESVNSYIANPHPECVHNCLYLICSKCHKATHFDDDKLAYRLNNHAANITFQPQRLVMELTGICKNCQSPAT